MKHGVHSCFSPGVSRTPDDMGGDGDNGRVSATCCLFHCANSSRGLETIDFRHADVHQNNAEVLFRRRCHRVKAIFDGRGARSQPTERFDRNLAVDSHVVRDKRPQRRKLGKFQALVGRRH